MPATHIEPEHGIYRGPGDDGWYVKAVHKSVGPKPFFDVSYQGDPALSYDAAVAYNRELRPFEEGVRNVRQARTDKFMADELPIGVSLTKVETLNKGGKGTQTVYNLRVSQLGVESGTKTIYVGTHNTWQKNLAKKIEEAIAYREKLKSQVRRKSR